MKVTPDPHDSDGALTPLDDEKKIGGARDGGIETEGPGHQPPDPDAALSDEEKAGAVCVLKYSPRPGICTDC